MHITYFYQLNVKYTSTNEIPNLLNFNALSLGPRRNYIHTEINIKLKFIIAIYIKKE